MPLNCYIDNFQLYKENIYFYLYGEKKKAYLELNKIIPISELAVTHYVEHIFACGAEIKHIPEQLRKEPEINNDNY